MCSNVSLEIATQCKSLAAYVTLVWFISRVKFLVVDERMTVSKLLITYITFERLLSGMERLMTC